MCNMVSQTATYRAHLVTCTFLPMYWITISTSLLTFFALVVRAVLKSRRHKCSACCFSCERAEGADGMDIDIEAPDFTPRRS